MNLLWYFLSGGKEQLRKENQAGVLLVAPVLAHTATHLAWPTQCTGKRSRAYPQAGALSRYEGPKRTKHHAKTMFISARQRS